MGQSKPLLDLEGVALLRRHYDVLTRCGTTVVCVLGAAAEECHASLPPDALVVSNPRWAHTWPIDSLRCALLAFPDVADALVTPCDVLPAAPSTVDALLRDSGDRDVVPRGPDGADGHPVRLGAATLARVRAGTVDGGLRSLLADATRVDVPDATVAVGFNDPEAWRAATRLWRKRSS